LKKIRLGIIFGGKSPEHEVSLQSAKNILSALDQEKYEPILIGIDKTGRWYRFDSSEALLSGDPGKIPLSSSGEELALVPGVDSSQLIHLADRSNPGQIDVAFPVLHGTYGEDGTVQGMLKLANIPFVGASVLGSAVGMDKDVTKRLLKSDGIPVADFRAFGYGEQKDVDFEEISEKLGMPVFVKPANMGSSVGVSKAYDRKGLKEAIQKAFRYDTKIIIEENISGRELECSVLGNENPIASLPGEILPRMEFYTYEAKYMDENGAALEIPARLSGQETERVRECALRAYRSLCCEGMARVDLFRKENGEIVVNEINTIPGFTRISMYPKLWEVSGLSYGELIDRLIGLALERFKREQALKTNVEI
jgi:D-alanine-D-alanine ligase